MTPSRGPGNASRVREGLSERDFALLADLFRVRLLSGSQVRRLHVAEGSGLTQARRARGVLQRLHDLQLVHRLERRVGGVRAGSEGFIYGLTARGQRVLNGHGPAGGSRLRRVWETRPTFTDHLLRVSELFVRLREEERAGAIELLTFDAEPAGWRAWTAGDGSRSLLKPDAFVVAATPDYEFRTFVEVDCATETRPVLRRKAEAFVTYWLSGIEQQREGVFPRVLWLAPNESRQQRIVEVLGTLPADSWQLFHVVHFDNALAALCGGTP